MSSKWEAITYPTKHVYGLGSDTTRRIAAFRRDDGLLLHIDPFSSCNGESAPVVLEELNSVDELRRQLVAEIEIAKHYRSKWQELEQKEKP